MIKDFIIDWETFGNVSRSAVIDVAAVVFDPNPEVVETFDELVQRGMKLKFNLKAQQGVRLFGASTMKWWKSQSEEARKNLLPSDEDIDHVEGLYKLLQFLKDNGVDPWKSFGWCRGQSFDFPILVDILREGEARKGIAEKDIDTFGLEPCKFWNQRDIRTAIESLLLTRDLTTTPLRKGVLDGFIAHDSIHDCAKDILMLKYAQRYALGLEDAPESDEIDPLSLPKGRG